MSCDLTFAVLPVAVVQYSLSPLSGPGQDRGRCWRRGRSREYSPSLGSCRGSQDQPVWLSGLTGFPVLHQTHETSPGQQGHLPYKAAVFCSHSEKKILIYCEKVAFSTYLSR